MPIPESQRSSVPMRVPKDTLPLLDRMGDTLRVKHGGGRWSRGDCVAIAVRAWLRREGVDTEGRVA